MIKLIRFQLKDSSLCKALLPTVSL